MNHDRLTTAAAVLPVVTVVPSVHRRCTMRSSALYHLSAVVPLSSPLYHPHSPLYHLSTVVPSFFPLYHLSAVVPLSSPLYHSHSRCTISLPLYHLSPLYHSFSLYTFFVLLYHPLSRCTIPLPLYHSLPSCTILFPVVPSFLPLYHSLSRCTIHPARCSLHPPVLFPLFSLRCTICTPLHHLHCCSIIDQQMQAANSVKASGLKRRRRNDSDAVQQEQPLPLHPNRATAVPSLVVRVGLPEPPVNIVSSSIAAPHPQLTCPLLSSEPPSPSLFSSVAPSFLPSPPPSPRAPLFSDSPIPGTQPVIGAKESLQSSASLGFSMLATTPSPTPLPTSSSPPPVTTHPPVPAPAPPAPGPGPALPAQPTAGYTWAQVLECCKACGTLEQYQRMGPIGFMRMPETWGKFDSALRKRMSRIKNKDQSVDAALKQVCKNFRRRD
jgi:hypothetical protein